MFILGIVSSICTFFIKVLITLVTAIYQLGNYAYQVFLVLAKTNIFSQDQYEALTNKVYLVLGVVMLFVIAYNFLTFIVDPEKNKGGSSIEKMIKNTVTSLILIVLCPTLFSFAFTIQNAILEQGIINKFFSAGETTKGYEGESTIKQGGITMAVYTFTAFFTPSEAVGVTNESAVTAEEEYADTFSLLMEFKDKAIPLRKIAEACGEDIYKINTFMNDEINMQEVDRINPKCVHDDSFYLTEDWKNFKLSLLTANKQYTLKEAREVAIEKGSFGIYKTFAENVYDDQVDFSFLFALFAGAYLLYVIISFCFDLAVRVVKLAFYQIIAPVTIACRIIPDSEKIFTNWWKATSKTFLSVFTRVFIMNIGVFLISVFVNSSFVTTACENSECSPAVPLIAYAFIILGIITFVKTAPQLIDEVFGLESTPLGIKDKLKAGGAFAIGGAVGAGVTGLARNATRGIKEFKKTKGQGGGKRTAAAFRGIGSAFAGGASAMLSGGRAGAKAGSAAEMKAASKKGAEHAEKRREERAAYKASHNILDKDGNVVVKGTTFGVGALATAAGKIKDAGHRIGSWAGVNNTADLEKENAALQQLTAEIDAVGDAVRKALEDNAVKGKSYSFGITGSASADKLSKACDKVTKNVDFSMDNIRLLQEKIAESKRTGESVSVGDLLAPPEMKTRVVQLKNSRGEVTGTKRVNYQSDVKFSAEELEKVYNAYMKEYTNAGTDVAFKGDSGYQAAIGTDIKEIAAFTSARNAASQARATVKNSLNSEIVQQANSGMDAAHSINSSNVDGDLVFTDGALDNIKPLASIQISNNQQKINEMRRKDKEAGEK